MLWIKRILVIGAALLVAALTLAFILENQSQVRLQFMTLQSPELPVAFFVALAFIAGGLFYVIATTALDENQIDLIDKASEEIPVFRSANMSLGINVVSKMLKTAFPSLEEDFDTEIIEKHHNQKLDSPSGTALFLADAVNAAATEKKEYIFGRHGKNERCNPNEMGIHSVRGGSIPGQHTVVFAGPDEVIELSHTVYSRDVFAYGALKAARFLVTKTNGLYSMEDMV